MLSSSMKLLWKFAWNFWATEYPDANEESPRSSTNLSMTTDRPMLALFIIPSAALSYSHDSLASCSPLVLGALQDIVIREFFLRLLQKLPRLLSMIQEQSGLTIYGVSPSDSYPAGSLPSASRAPSLLALLLTHVL